MIMYFPQFQVTLNNMIETGWFLTITKYNEQSIPSEAYNKRFSFGVKVPIQPIYLDSYRNSWVFLAKCRFVWQPYVQIHKGIITPFITIVIINTLL